LRLQEELISGRLAHGGPVTLLLGNPEAVRADVRFLEEDFNRVFTFDRPATSLERQRAELVRPLLDQADWFLDFHQTQTPTERAFWTFPWDVRLADLARALGPAHVGLTRKPGQAFSAGLRCLDEYVRDRGRIGTTVEVGMRGQDQAQAEVTYRAARRLIALVDDIDAGRTTLADRAAEQPALSWFRTAHVVLAETPEHRLRPGLQNWSAIHAGEVLSAEGAPLIIAPVDGVALFPKYVAPGQAPPPELVRIAVAVDDPHRELV
jgi:succinylglutamate desuccinylase